MTAKRDDAAAMAIRLEPFIRRAVLQGRASVRLVGMIAGDPLDLVTVDLASDTRPDDVAAEIEGVILTDCDSAEPAAYYRVEAEGGDKPGAGMVLRPPRRHKGDAPDVGDMLVPRGVPAEGSLLRMMARHSENAVARAVSAQDRAFAAMVTAVEQLAKTNESLRSQLVKDAEAAGAYHRNTIEAEARLIEAGGKAEAAREAGRALRYIAPRIADKLTGADKLAPVLRVVSKLTPDQIETAVSVGLISGEDAEALVDLWHDLKDEKKDRKRLREGEPEGKGKPATVVRLRQTEGKD